MPAVTLARSQTFGSSTSVTTHWNMGLLLSEFPSWSVMVTTSPACTDDGASVFAMVGLGLSRVQLVLAEPPGSFDAATAAVLLPAAVFCCV